MGKVTTLRSVSSRQHSALPHYELRARRLAGTDMEIEIWQLPASATPHIKQPTYIAGLRGRNLSLIEHRLLRRMKQVRIDLLNLPAIDALRVPVDEDMAINLGLLLRVLAPMRNREHIAAVAAGIEAMTKEEAGYWLGMAMHRKHPRRVLMALRFLLIEPSR
ncbi:hypothetical protein J3L14_17845 [Burkholderia pseudomallei]|jgi:hypothetical protein|uniref:DUF7680 family protein n=1 Tax=Burkholderia TaxID=32008 RepID=UPI0009E0D7E5|nr:MULTISPECIES: hypothetical protein [Burkholderia]AYY98697.1 hypothetical protein EGY19_15365 [Burkholderia multivorans]MCA8374010.1 hypothetical protein [Burkholderia multivorans]QTB79306.1 hypothetical protein J3L14_17845 [Burkholderia pseudomallei]SAK14079.1 hypothetical protein UA17_00801 [Burkholderia multivorans]